MITRGTSAQITVVALIGERGREVREFLENDLGPDPQSKITAASTCVKALHMITSYY